MAFGESRELESAEEGGTVTRPLVSAKSKSQVLDLLKRFSYKKRERVLIQRNHDDGELMHCKVGEV